MDNQINTAMPGLPLPNTSDSVISTKSLAAQWQQELLTAGAELTQVVAVPGLSETDAAVLDASLTLSLQLLTAGKPASIDITPYAITDSNEVEISLVANADEGVLFTGPVISFDLSGKAALTETRLLGWGNAGQGVLSYFFSFQRADEFANPQQNRAAYSVMQATAARASMPDTESTLGMSAASQSKYLLFGGAGMSRQANQLFKDSVTNAANGNKAAAAYDIPPQALFFVANGQHGYRATVRDYFNKDETTKRLYLAKQEGAFDFGNVQEIWLNGRPLGSKASKEHDYAG